jgi:hypothetical protein
MHDEWQREGSFFRTTLRTTFRMMFSTTFSSMSHKFFDSSCIKGMENLRRGSAAGHPGASSEKLGC